MKASNYPVTSEKCVKNLITFPDESEFDLDKLGFTMKELYVILRGLTSFYELEEHNVLRDKVRHLICGLQSLERRTFYDNHLKIKELEQHIISKIEQELKDNNYKLL